MSNAGCSLNAADLEVLWLQRASSLTRSLQVAFPAVTILELPAELWRWGQDKDRVTAGIGVLLLGWWLSLQRDSSCRRSILIFSICPVVCEPHQSSVTLLPPLLQPGSLISKSPLLPTPSFSCNVSLDIVHNTAVSPPPCYPARQTTEWQREVMSRMAFSAKFLLKIPGKLISFSPYSAFATFFLPKLHAYLWQN